MNILNVLNYVHLDVFISVLYNVRYGSTRRRFRGNLSIHTVRSSPIRETRRALDRSLYSKYPRRQCNKNDCGSKWYKDIPIQHSRQGERTYSKQNHQPPIWEICIRVWISRISLRNPDSGQHFTISYQTCGVECFPIAHLTPTYVTEEDLSYATYFKYFKCFDNAIKVFRNM